MNGDQTLRTVTARRRRRWLLVACAVLVAGYMTLRPDNTEPARYTLDDERKAVEAARQAIADFERCTAVWGDRDPRCVPEYARAAFCVASGQLNRGCDPMEAEEVIDRICAGALPNEFFPCDPRDEAGWEPTAYHRWWCDKGRLSGRFCE